MTNATDQPRLARMTWPDGFVQVSRIEPLTTSYLSGAIGTSAFPVSIDALDEDCAVLASVAGLEPGSYGLLTITDDGVSLTALRAGDATWKVAGSLQTCGATELPSFPPPPMLRTPEAGATP